MANDRTYSPVEVCQIFGISKSTLLRWEREGILPPVGRGIRSDQRKYTQEHIRAISQKQKEKLQAHKEKLSKQYGRATRAENIKLLSEVHEALSMRKILEGDLTGLQELAEYPQLSIETLRQLLRMAMDHYEPTDPVFSHIVQVVWKQSRKFSKK